MEASNRRFVSQGFLVLFVGAFCLGLLQENLAAEDTEEVPRMSETCLVCHEGYDAGLASSPHRLPEDTLDGPDARVTCTDCHVGDARHYEEDPEEYPMTDPSRVGVPVAGRICSTCHMNSHQQDMMEGNVHAESDVNCSGCHRIHGSEEAGLLKAAEFELCLGCHTNIEGEFSQPFRHPVNDAIVTCSECHLTLDETRTELSLNGSNACTDCHTEFQGPFPFEHQAAVDYSTEEGGCLNCHDPHGSAQPRILKQPYEPPHFQLCTQCHFVPPLHNRNSQHGTMWAGIPCNDCHTDIHGSYTSRSFLSESLEGEGCFTSGCHPPGR